MAPRGPGVTPQIQSLRGNSVISPAVVRLCPGSGRVTGEPEGMAWLGCWGEWGANTEEYQRPRNQSRFQLLGLTWLGPPQGPRYSHIRKPRLSTASEEKVKAIGELPTPPLQECPASAGRRRAHINTDSCLKNMPASERQWWVAWVGLGGRCLQASLLGPGPAEQVGAYQGPPGKLLPEPRWLRGPLVLHNKAWYACGFLLPDPPLHRRSWDRG